MPRRIRSDVRYRSNGLPAYNQRWGPRAMDEVTSFPSHRDRLIQDDFGLWMDPRYTSPDIDEGAYMPGPGPGPSLPQEQGGLPPPDPPIVPTPGEATTYYVSPTGSDAADGSEVTPFATLQYAHDQMVDGESCTVMDGWYTEGMGVRTPGLTFIAESANHVIHSPENDIITLFEGADRTALSGLKVASAIRAGFYITHSDNVTLTDCEASFCQRQGLLASYSNYLTISGGDYSDTVEQHGVYVSNHSHYPTIEDLTNARNGKAGIQINADRQAAADPPDYEGPILGAVVRNCVLTANCQTHTAASLNILGCWGATIENVDVVDGLFNGIAFGNDDNLQPEGLFYGSKDCTMTGVTVTGARGISVHRGSTNLTMDDVTVNVTSSACIDYDDYSFPPMTLGNTYDLTPGSAFEAFRNSTTGTNYTVAEWRAL